MRITWDTLNHIVAKKWFRRQGLKAYTHFSVCVSLSLRNVFESFVQYMLDSIDVKGFAMARNRLNCCLLENKGKHFTMSSSPKRKVKMRKTICEMTWFGTILSLIQIFMTGGIVCSSLFFLMQKRIGEYGGPKQDSWDYMQWIKPLVLLRQELSNFLWNAGRC